MSKRQRTTIWVIMYYEFSYEDDIDRFLFHVSSTRKKAEEHICKIGDNPPYSWWQMHPYQIDCDSWTEGEGDEVYYYSHTGKPLKQAPHMRALVAYHKSKAKKDD